MKYRKDFVTNSSSSSFVCEICGRSESGYDMSLEDAGMYECVNGHVFCQDEAMTDFTRQEKIEMLKSYTSGDGYYDYSSPVCDYFQTGNSEQYAGKPGNADFSVYRN